MSTLKDGWKFCVVLSLLCVAASFAYAQGNGRDMAKEATLWEELRAVAPDMVDVFKQATELMDADDPKAAIPLYQKVVDAAPQFDSGLRRLGMCLSESGDTQRGIEFVEKAVAARRSPDNLSSLALVLAFPGNGQPVPRETQQRALSLVNEAIQNRPSPDAQDLLLKAQLSQSLDDVEGFRDATAQLVQHFPDLPQSHLFNAMRAAVDERWTEAEDEIRRAGQLGLPSSVVESFLASGIHSRATVWRYAWYAAYATVAWIGGLLLLFVFGKTLSASTLSSIAHDSGAGVVSATELKLRKIYRRLIDLAGYYYYISLPFVTLLLIAAAGSVFYAFLALGRIPIRLMLILAVVTVGTIYKMVQSLFIKVKAQDPGRELTREEAPALWTLTEEVANDVGTRAVAQIRMTPGTEVAVYEKGSRAEKRQDKATRILILGVGALNGLRTTPFRAILAHEYGHFTHRDTAGGDVALRVSNDMINFAIAMARAGHAVWWNLGFQFVRVYHFIFRRISYGASRLQEVLADRMAALKYGADAFEEGLTHVIRRSIEFPFAANREIAVALEGGRALHNLYDLSTASEDSVEDEIKKALTRATSEDDTHPSPADRFHFVHRIRSEGRPADSGMVWDLFRDREVLTSEMSGMIDATLDRSARPVPESAVPKFKEIDL